MVALVCMIINNKETEIGWGDLTSALQQDFSPLLTSHTCWAPVTRTAGSFSCLLLHALSYTPGSLPLSNHETKCMLGFSPGEDEFS